MTKENREAAYKNFRLLERTYEAQAHLDSGLTSTDRVRAHSKEIADAMLKKHPELEVKEVKKKAVKKTKEEVKE